MEKSSLTIEDIENGHRRLNSVHEKAALRQKYSQQQMTAINHRRKCKSVAMTIFTLLCITFCFLFLSYVYEPDMASHKSTGAQAIRSRILSIQPLVPMSWSRSSIAKVHYLKSH